MLENIQIGRIHCKLCEIQDRFLLQKKPRRAHVGLMFFRFDSEKKRFRKQCLPVQNGLASNIC